MKTTYYVPTDPEHQAELAATIKRLFPGCSDPTITPRATGTGNIDWDHLESLADLLDAQVITAPFVVFSIDPAPDTYSPEQLDILERPGVEVKRDYQPGEILDNQEGE